MPVLFFHVGGKPRLFGIGRQPLEKQVFKEFRIKGLSRGGPRFAVATLWHLTKLSHTAIAWKDQSGIEQVVFLPGFLKHSEALQAARSEFGPWIPSPIVFRFKNERKAKRG